MKTIALFLLFAWPWSAHVEKFSAEIQPNGFAIVHFKKVFDKDVSQIHCTVAHRSVSREWVELLGKPGEKVSGSCQ